jgi:predicted metalloprotease
VSGDQIALNPDYFGDLKKLKQTLELMEQRGFTVKGSSAIDYVMTHEFGHQVDNTLTRKYGFEILQFKGSHLASPALSDYAMTHRSEAWAEGFAAYYHTPIADQTDYVKEQRKLIEELLKKLRQP